MLSWSSSLLTRLAVLHSIFLPTHCLPSNFNIVATKDSDESGIYPVAVTITNHPEKYCQSRPGDSVIDPLSSSPVRYWWSCRAWFLPLEIQIRKVRTYETSKEQRLRAISPFPMVFSKDLLLQTRKKPRLVWERVNTSLRWI